MGQKSQGEGQLTESVNMLKPERSPPTVWMNFAAEEQDFDRSLTPKGQKSVSSLRQRQPGAFARIGPKITIAAAVKTFVSWDQGVSRTVGDNTRHNGTMKISSSGASKTKNRGGAQFCNQPSWLLLFVNCQLQALTFWGRQIWDAPKNGRSLFSYIPLFFEYEYGYEASDWHSFNASRRSSYDGEKFLQYKISERLTKNYQCLPPTTPSTQLIQIEEASPILNPQLPFLKQPACKNWQLTFRELSMNIYCTKMVQRSFLI